MSEAVQARLDLRQWLIAGDAPCPATETEGRALVAAAAEQGLCGLLHADVVAQRVPWPDVVIESLREAHRLVLVNGVRQLDAAARVCTLLRDRGLRSLPLKGAALVERLYASAGERPMSDVDILALDDWPASVRALRDAGFRDVEAADHARSFTDPLSGALVELHHGITSCPELHPVRTEALWARSLEAGGQIARVPSPEDLLVHLSLHAAFQHGLVLTLVQFLDFRRLFARMPPETDRVLSVAGEMAALGALAASIAAASTVVGLAPPPSLAEALQPHVPRGLRPLLDRSRREPLLLVAPAPPALARVRWSLAAGRRLTLLAGTLAPREPGAPRSLHRALVRAGTLAWRWGPLMNRA